MTRHFLSSNINYTIYISTITALYNLLEPASGWKLKYYPLIVT